MPREWMSPKKRANGKVPGKKRGKSPDPKGLKKALKTPPPKGAEAASSSGEKPVKRKITFQHRVRDNKASPCGCPLQGLVLKVSRRYRRTPMAHARAVRALRCTRWIDVRAMTSRSMHATHAMHACSKQWNAARHAMDACMRSYACKPRSRIIKP